jgi:hypothetical protein
MLNFHLAVTDTANQMVMIFTRDLISEAPIAGTG